MLMRQGHEGFSSFTAPVPCAVKNRSKAEPGEARPSACLLRKEAPKRMNY